MNKTLRIFLATTAIASVAFASPAFAGGESDLQTRVDALEAQLKELKTMIKSQNSSGEASGVEFSLSPGASFKASNGMSFGLGGKVHVESAFFNDDLVDHPDGTEIRRAQMAMVGNIAEDWAFKLEAEFAGNATTVTDAFLIYNGFENTYWEVGSFKEPFSIDFLTSDESNLFIEFASLNMFTPERSIGIGVGTHGNNWSLTAGGFGQGTGVTPADDEGKGVTARLTYAPVNEAGKVLHLGVAGSYRVPDEASSSLRYSDKPEAHQAAALAVDTGVIAGVDNFTVLGLEASAIWDSVFVQGRYANSSLDITGGADADFNGYYIEAGWAITGESMTYNAGNGTFRRIKPNNDFKLGSGIGAWEVAARYSTIDLNDGAITGGEMNNWVVGLNWYVNDRTRFMLNYTVVDTDENAVTPNDEPQIIALRAQYDF